MSTLVEARRPGMRSLLTLIRCEAKMVVRDTAGLVVPLCLPLLIMLTSASGASQTVVANGRTALDLYVLPLVFTMVIAIIGIINMPSFLAYYRRSGILRRLGVTPASPAMVLVAQATVSVLQATIGITTAVLVAFLAFGANPPVDIGAALGVLALATAALYSTGMIVAAVAPTPNSAVAIGLVAFFVLGALGGMFGGRDALPEGLAEIGGWLPFGAAVEALSSAWAGTAVEAPQLLGLATTIVVGALVASILFRWE
ncbi:ABC-2 type transport system permease protein [Micromonospora phaseoli]|uniref:ABC-2 type transport system permease protein n=1 Tax=Micromonospora phaseoli TaxID=1144548 RepID=A0A1H6VM66_9ACTN|nr:ABC transporter permease [Micromonospora phaseoli]PZV93595.1 ABC-2 type transport system permease protein [Micromonospora phaseoli]GIJ80224.1 transport permease protein [Micromonospora phaseoli]SEJ02817.1 ABC-2 type transport system permease protein [Micromonospora phaseoli]